MSDEVKITTTPVTVEEKAALKAVRVPVVQPAGKRVAPPKPAATVKPPEKPKAAVGAPPKPEPIKKLAEDTSLLDEFVRAMPQGMTLTITKIATNQWSVVKGQPQVEAAVPSGKRGGAKKNTAALSDEYKAFLSQDAGKGKSWHNMSLEEKYAYAQEIGASWVVHSDARIDLMRVTVAVLAALGIPKHVGDAAEPVSEPATEAAAE
jgi:hypothetical protein